MKTRTSLSFALVALLAALATACAGAGAPARPQRAPEPATFFPLAVGNEWVYRDESPALPAEQRGSRRTVRILERTKDGYFRDSERGELRADADCLHDRSRRLLCGAARPGHDVVVHRLGELHRAVRDRRGRRDGRDAGRDVRAAASASARTTGRPRGPTTSSRSRYAPGRGAGPDRDLRGGRDGGDAPRSGPCSRDTASGGSDHARGRDRDRRVRHGRRRGAVHPAAPRGGHRGAARRPDRRAAGGGARPSQGAGASTSTPRS